MIAEIKINIGTVVVNISTAFKKAEVEAAREQLTSLVSAAFNRHVAAAKAQWRDRHPKRPSVSTRRA